MIRYTLECDNDHRFESWFASSGAYDSLRAGGHVACAVCASTDVRKSLMAPSVSLSEDKPLTTRLSPQEKAAQELRRKVEENAEYVGLSFATEARAIHDGDAPERPIYGEARLDEARKLIEDGVPVAPLPFMPRKRAN